MPSIRYAELRCKSSFSFLRGASHPEELARAAAELGLSALAVTDVHGLYGVVRAHAEATRHGLSLIVGAEIACRDVVAGASRTTPLVLLAMDREGYATLCRLLTGVRCHGDLGTHGAPERRDGVDVPF